MKKSLKIFLLSSLLLFTSLMSVNYLLPKASYAAPCEPGNSILGIPTWYKYLEGDNSSGRCNPVLEQKGEDDPRRFNVVLPIGLAILEILIRLAGLVAVVMVFIGSFKFITSQGNADNAAGARKTIINALIGLVIVVLATTIINFIGNSLT